MSKDGGGGANLVMVVLEELPLGTMGGTGAASSAALHSCINKAGGLRDSKDVTGCFLDPAGGDGACGASAEASVQSSRSRAGGCAGRRRRRPGREAPLGVSGGNGAVSLSSSHSSRSKVGRRVFTFPFPAAASPVAGTGAQSAGDSGATDKMRGRASRGQAARRLLGEGALGATGFRGHGRFRGLAPLLVRGVEGGRNSQAGGVCGACMSFGGLLGSLFSATAFASTSTTAMDPPTTVGQAGKQSKGKSSAPGGASLGRSLRCSDGRVQASSEWRRPGMLISASEWPSNKAAPVSSQSVGPKPSAAPLKAPSRRSLT